MAYLGWVLLLIAIGILVPLAFFVWYPRPAPSPQPGEKEPSLTRELKRRVEADRRRRMYRFGWMAWTLFLVGSALVMAPYIGGPASPKANGSTTTPIVVPGVNTSSASSFGFSSALVIANVALLGIGALLLLFGRGKTAKAAGLLSIAGGLIGHAYLVKDVKIDKIFGIEKLLSVGDPRLKLEIQKVMAEGNTGSAPEHIGTFPRFALGSADLKKANFDAEAEADRICAVWQQHAEEGQDGVLLIVGATDRMPLRRPLASQYDANVGLAQARAEEVRKRLLTCINASTSRHPINPTRVLTLASGPVTTPEGKSGLPAAAEGYPDDRRVDVWAFWTGAKTP